MATGGSPQQRCPEEAACSICLEYFTDPVTTECGHNFCRACLARSCGQSEESASCPLCREPLQREKFVPNHQLANLIELVKKLHGEEKPPPKKGLCEKHEEPLKLFCRDHEALICVVCEKSKEHEEHRLMPTDEAAQEYKRNIQYQQQSLKEKRLQLLTQTDSEELRGRRCSLELKEAREKCMSAFELMQKDLEKTKHSWLVQLDDLEKEIEKRQKENIARLSEESSNVSNLIKEMAKCQLSEHEFLQDIRSILCRFKAAQRWQLDDFFPRLDETLTMWTQKNTALVKPVKTVKESLEEALQKAYVTPDQNTAHRCLGLYDRGTVRRIDIALDLTDNPERFDTKFWVLGCERFTSGRHWWEIEVRDPSTEWAVGVARESVRRKGDIGLNTDEGIWAVGYVLSRGFYDKLLLTSFTSPTPTTLHSERECRKIRVSLDYEAGCVAFSDADSGKLIFTFPSASFSGERLYPFFQLKSRGSGYSGELRLCN